MTNAAFISDVAPVGLDNVNARMALKNNRLTIENLSGQMGGGTFSVSGFASYAPVSFSLQVNGQSVRIRYPQGTRANSMPTSPSAEPGRFSIERARHHRPALLHAGLRSGKLRLPIQLLWRFRAASLGTKYAPERGRGIERCTGPFQQPIKLAGIGGFARCGNPGGARRLGKIHAHWRIAHLYAQCLSNPERHNRLRQPGPDEPTLNLYVNTMVQNYDITLNFLGPLDRLRTNYTSIPPCPRWISFTSWRSAHHGRGGGHRHVRFGGGRIRDRQ